MHCWSVLLWSYFQWPSTTDRAYRGASWPLSEADSTGVGRSGNADPVSGGSGSARASIPSATAPGGDPDVSRFRDGRQQGLGDRQWTLQPDPGRRECRLGPLGRPADMPRGGHPQPRPTTVVSNVALTGNGSATISSGSIDLGDREWQAHLETRDLCHHRLAQCDRERVDHRQRGHLVLRLLGLPDPVQQWPVRRILLADQLRDR